MTGRRSRRSTGTGSRGGLATFETEVPSWERWDAEHSIRARRGPRRAGGRLGGALACLDALGCYAASRRTSVYVARDQRRGAASAARCWNGLIDEAPRRPASGRSRPSIFPENRASPAVAPPRAASASSALRRSARQARRPLARHRPPRATERGDVVIKVEAVVIRERVETVIDAVEEATGHVGVTVVEAVGHGRQRGITHEYRGRIFESRFLPEGAPDLRRRRRSRRRRRRRDRRRGAQRQRVGRRARLDDAGRQRHAQPDRTKPRGGGGRMIATLSNRIC